MSIEYNEILSWMAHTIIIGEIFSHTYKISYIIREIQMHVYSTMKFLNIVSLKINSLQSWFVQNAKVYIIQWDTIGYDTQMCVYTFHKK